jgi:cellulose synthase/poly-beta-1,6-N-acetylglucosamine synthase-like glycosyltransferase
MVIVPYIWIVAQVLVGYNLVLPLVLCFFYLFTKKRSVGGAPLDYEPDYAIIVTAYEQTDSLPPVIESILKLNYNNFIVYIVADKCDVSGLHFSDERVIVLRPPDALSSNTRSHFYAIHNFKRQHDVLTIIDSDNLVDPDYIRELNYYFEKGFVAVQGLRKAKNLDTTYACLDAARDMYYHFYDGEVLFALGSSATLAGSGMAFKTALYRECLEHLDISGAGFDKVLQMEIVRRGHRIAFNERAVVYDEKTTRSDQLVKQRSRWINTWFRYFKFGFVLVASGVRRLSFNQFLFGIILLRPPLFMFLLLSVVCLAVNIFLGWMGLLLWMAAFFGFVLGFAIAIAHARPDKRVIQSLVGIPKFIFYQVISLLKIRKANKMSVATHHYHVKSIDEVNKV